MEHFWLWCACVCVVYICVVCVCRCAWRSLIDWMVVPSTAFYCFEMESLTKPSTHQLASLAGHCVLGIHQIQQYDCRQV